MFHEVSTCRKLTYINNISHRSGSDLKKSYVPLGQQIIGGSISPRSEQMQQHLRHGKERTFYAKYSYLTREVFWDDANFGYFDLGGMIRIENGPIYPYTFRKSLTKGTKYQYSALEQLRKEPGFSPIEYLQRYEKYPVLEQMVKAGLRKLALQMDLSKLNLKAKKPWELFGLTKDAFHTLRQINGGKEEMASMRIKRARYILLAEPG